eukprot:1153434-Pelagomonas_calceolata.AAC.7
MSSNAFKVGIPNPKRLDPPTTPPCPTASTTAYPAPLTLQRRQASLFGKLAKVFPKPGCAG